MQLKIKKMHALAFITMNISFMSGYSVFYGFVGSPIWYLLYYGKYLFTLLFIVCSFSKKNHDFAAVTMRKKFNMTFITYQIVILAYSTVIWILEAPSFDFISRGISSTIFSCIAYAGGISIAAYLKEDALRCGIFAALATYVMSISLGLMRGGAYFLRTSLFFRTTSVQGYYTELHEVAFVMGLYIVFLLYVNRGRFIEKTKLITFFCIFFFLIAWKRIGIAAALIVSLYILIIRGKSKAFISHFIKITGMFAIVICLVYVSFSVSDELTIFFQSHGIKMMGRNIIYNYFRQFCDFHINFLGHGVGFVTRQFDYTTSADLYNMASVKALHNDLMKIFIDIGFTGFLVWCWFWLIKIPQDIEKCVGVEASFWVMCFIMFAFVTYTTDNTEGYFSFQMHLVMIIYTISYYYTGLERKRYLNV